MKFSIVTPTFNSERFLSETIESVIKQKGDFSIEYNVVDNCSNDHTASIVKQYQQAIETGEFQYQCNDIQLYFIQEPDAGMYDAICKGFSRATGDVFAWINSDDIYLEGAFDNVSKVFFQYPEVQWLKGTTSYIDENSETTSQGRCFLYAQNWIRKGVYGPVLYFIQQDSVFWRSALWESGHDEISKYSLSGDYILWREFAKCEPLYTLNVFLSCFRKVTGQKSENIQAYWAELEQNKNIDCRLMKLLKTYFRIEAKLPVPFVPFFRKLFFGKQMYQLILIGGDGLPKLYKGQINQLESYL